MRLSKTSFLLTLLCVLHAVFSWSQQAPAHLKYFGFTAIDCFYDDPLDASPLTNYIAEVDSFSNIAHMCVYNAESSIVQRVNLMNQHCVNPVLHIQNIFFQVTDNNAPSGVNYDLFPDFNDRWNTFLTTNAAVLSAQKISCFYVADEPAWNGMDAASMDTICSLLKSSCPQIPLFMVEAYTTVSAMVVPAQMDWIGFDRYGVYDPENDIDFQNDLDTVKAKLSSPGQRLFLIIDDQWFPEYETYLGWSQNTMAEVVQNYYDLAASDTMICGMIGYIWPGGLDAPNHHGVRNMTQAVKMKNREIGKKIKANYSPCAVLSLPDLKTVLVIFPNPAGKSIRISSEVPEGTTFRISDAYGRECSSGIISASDNSIDIANLSAGIYTLTAGGLQSRFIKE